jgi:hypothetical protein
MGELSEEALEDYNAARQVWHANPAAVRTSQFDEARMNVEVWPVVTFEGRTWNGSDLGYGDSLRRLCGGTVMGTSEKTGDGLRISLSTGEIHINPALEEVHAEIALLQMRGTPELGEPGEWMCSRRGDASFEHLAWEAMEPSGTEAPSPIAPPPRPLEDLLDSPDPWPQKGRSHRSPWNRGWRCPCPHWSPMTSTSWG